MVEQKESYIWDFSPVGHEDSYFPIKLWRRLSNKALLQPLALNRYSDGRGEESLRDEIAKYLSTSRALNAKASNIVITSGFIDAMSIVAKLLKSSFKEFAIESPGYYIAEGIFKDFGYNIKKISLDSDGVSIDNFKQSGAKLLYITPSHQYPTGRVLPVAKRQKLLQYISLINGYLIEDDYDSELNYISRPIPSLQGLDSSDSVIYVGTFSKSLSPAIRVAYLHLPDRLLESFKMSYYNHFPRVSLQIQATLTEFLKGGYFEKHLRKMRTINRKKHNLMLESLNKELGNSFEVVTKGAGLAILIYPATPFNWKKFKELGRENGIKLYFASLCNTSNFEAIRLGFGGFKLEDIPKAIKLFGKIYKESIE